MEITIKGELYPVAWIDFRERTVCIISKDNRRIVYGFNEIEGESGGILDD